MWKQRRRWPVHLLVQGHPDGSDPGGLPQAPGAAVEKQGPASQGSALGKSICCKEEHTVVHDQGKHQKWLFSYMLVCDFPGGRSHQHQEIQGVFDRMDFSQPEPLKEGNGGPRGVEGSSLEVSKGSPTCRPVGHSGHLGRKEQLASGATPRPPRTGCLIQPVQLPS